VVRSNAHAIHAAHPHLPLWGGAQPPDAKRQAHGRSGHCGKRPGIEADALVTLRAYYRGRQQTILEAEQRGLPIYVLRANTNNQIEQLLADIFNLSLGSASVDNWDDYTSQTQSAIQAVLKRRAVCRPRTGRGPGPAHAA
jgi:hypothetical protein